MAPRIGLTALFLSMVVSATSAQTLVDLDSVFASASGVEIFSDGFDNDVLGAEWFTLGTTPGPESGTVLRMDAGDFILRLVDGEATTVGATMNLTQFPAGSAASLILSAGGGDSLTLTVEPSSVSLADEFGDLGSIALDPGSVAVMSVILGANGILAIVNGQTVFIGAEGNLGGPVSSVAFSVVPEPATIGLLSMGLFGLIRRKRSSRA